MMTVETLCVLFRGLHPEDLRRWVGDELLRPDTDPTAGGYVFRDIDVERVRLILELRDEMQVNEEALPVVLSLLDQLYEMRRRMRRVREALDQTVPDQFRQELIRRLTETP
jgi:chaperone modulatory protein CbpM